MVPVPPAPTGPARGAAAHGRGIGPRPDPGSASRAMTRAAGPHAPGTTIAATGAAARTAATAAAMPGAATARRDGTATARRRTGLTGARTTSSASTTGLADRARTATARVPARGPPARPRTATARVPAPDLGQARTRAPGPARDRTRVSDLPRRPVAISVTGPDPTGRVTTGRVTIGAARAVRRPRTLAGPARRAPRDTPARRPAPTTRC